jgi:hypothetical protein
MIHHHYNFKNMCDKNCKNLVTPLFIVKILTFPIESYVRNFKLHRGKGKTLTLNSGVTKFVYAYLHNQ